MGEEQRGSVLDAVRRLNELESERSGDEAFALRVLLHKLIDRFSRDPGSGLVKLGNYVLKLIVRLGQPVCVKGVRLKDIGT